MPATVDVTRFASFTLFSLVVDRVFAFAFTILMSATFGSSASLDAYLLAVAGPIIATTLLGDLIYSILLPEVVRSDAGHQGVDPRWSVIVWGAILLVGLTIFYAGIWVLTVTTLGASAETTPLLVLGLLTSPLVLLSGIAALGATVLIAERAYLAAMIRIPLASLVTMLSFLLWRQLTPGVEALVASVLSGALAAALLVTVLVGRVLGPISVSMNPSDAGRLLHRLAGTSAAQLAAGVLAQAPTLIERLIGIITGPGVVSSLNYGRVLVSPPLLIGQSIATALYPRFVGLTHQADERRYRELGRTIASVAFYLVPLSVLLAMFAGPLVRAVYQRGTFDDVAAARTEVTAFALALGLAPIAICAVTTRFLYAERLSARVALFSALTLVLYCVLAMGLSRFTYLGLATASSASYVFLMAALLAAVRGDHYRGWDHIPGRSLAQTAAAALVMLAVILVVDQNRGDAPLTGGPVGVLAAAAAGGAAYCAAAFVVRSPELRQAWAVLLRALRWGRVALLVLLVAT